MGGTRRFDGKQASLLVHPFTDNEFEQRRTALKHTWLENRLLRQIRQQRTEWLEKPGDGEPPSVIVGAAARCAEVRQLIQTLVDAYSPAQLVDAGPLRALQDEARRPISVAVHRIYLNLGVVQSLLTEIEEAVAGLEAAVALCIREWSANPNMRSAALDALDGAAVRLRETLEVLPRGIILP
jgi:hypothetical protein